MLVGLSGLTATPAAAVEDIDHVPLPTTGYAAEVVAASGTGIIMAKAGEDGAYQVSVDSGQTFSDLNAPAFTGQVSYVGAGKVLYVDPTGDTDDAGDFLNLYTYDLATTTTAAPVKVYAAEVKAVTPEHAVVANEVATGYSAVQLAGGSSNPLDVPDHAGVPAFTLSTGATALAATVARDGAGVLGAGFLDAVPLSGELSTSVPAPGLVAARLSDSRAYWVSGDASGATLCSATVATLASPACHTLATGDYSHARASLEAGPGWVVARLRSDSGNAAVEYVYLSGPDTVATVSPASGMVSVSVYGRGDTEAPLATVLTTDGGYVGTYAAGAVTSLFDLPEVPATTSALFVTPRTISGLDDRPALGISGQQAWTRPLDGVDLGNEQLLSPRATGLSVSGDRTLVTTASGAELLEPDRPALSVSGVSNGRSLSGPYFLSGSTANPAVMRVDGVPVPPVGPVVALFGSLALRSAATGYEVVDVAHPATVVSVDLAAHCPGDNFAATAIWGDWILAANTDSGDTVVLNYRHPANCYASAGGPLALGDGFALVARVDPDTGNPDLVAWNFLHGAKDVLATNPSMVATDGSHKVAWTTSTQLKTSTLDELVTPSAPRVLGVVADPLVAVGSPWTLDLDASKGLRDAGSGLAITNSAGDVVRRVDVPESPNGSVRVAWDGNIAGAPAPAGDYGWKLNLMSSDNAGLLVSTDGTSAVTGTVTVTGTLPSVGGVAPTLSPATPVTGSPVTAQTGGWTPVGATFAYQWYLDSVALYGEVHPTYTPAHDDQGKELSVAVTGSAPAHTPLTLTSAQTKVAWPSVTGTTPQLSVNTPMVGMSISVDPGTWAPAGRALAYQWYRDAQAIGGATLPTYTALSADVGHRLKVAVTGSAFEHADLTRTSSESEAVARLPVTAGQPTLSVTSPVVGRSITAIPGTWSPAGVTFAYQWYRDAGAIGGATLATYVPVVGDFGHTLKVEVTGYAPERAPVTRTSASSAAVVTATFAPTVPVLSTTSPAVEQTVTAKTGTWGTSVVTFGYQWYRVSSKGKSRAISGATHGDYRVPAKDIGYKLKVKVTGSGAGMGSASLYSKLSAKVKKATFATAAAPTITGTAQVGHALRANPGTYSPQAAFKYQWYRGRKAIKRATSATYLLKAADKGKVMTVRVTATRAGYVTTVKSGKLATKVA